MPRSEDSPADPDDESFPVAYGVRSNRQVTSGDQSLDADRCLEIHRLMVRTRALEERTI